jgi:hypothetical protein
MRSSGCLRANAGTAAAAGAPAALTEMGFLL